MDSANADFFRNKILFVDDEPANLQLFRLQFDDGYQILTAGDAAEALAILEHEEIGVVLTDERMPGMRGIDLLAKVFERWPDVGRMIVSAYSDADRLLLAMNRGHAQGYVRKPWNANLHRDGDTAVDQGDVGV